MMKNENAEKRPRTLETRVRDTRRVYTLEALLAECDFTKPYSDEERAFLHAEPVGREVL